METLLRREHLSNGVRVDFFDCSNRYFGDYHRLRVEVRCHIPVTPQALVAAEDPQGEAERLRRRLGDEVLWVRHLERMGVAGGELDRVRQELVDTFIQSSFSYLASAEFPRRYLATQGAAHRTQARPFRLVK